MDVGLEMAADYEWSPTTTISAFAEFERLTPQIARAPNVREGGSRNQGYFGLSTSFKIFGK